MSANPRKQNIKSKVADRHQNFTKLGFPSTYQDANKNCIKNTVMDDVDPHIENNELVKKTNHVQNAIKENRKKKGGGDRDMDIKATAGIKAQKSDLVATMGRIYDQMASTRV